MTTPPHQVIGSALPQGRQRSRNLVQTGAVAGMVGPVLFTAAFLVQQWARRGGYAWVAEPVSNLEAGPHGWIQQANFVVFGALMGLFAVALYRGLGGPRVRGLGPVLVGLSGLGLFLAALMPIEADAAGRPYDPGGHFVAGVTFFLGSALAQLALGLTLRHDERWVGVARYAVVCGSLALVGFVVLGRFAVPDEAPLHDWAGLAQRAVIMLVTFPCLVAVAARLHRISRA